MKPTARVAYSYIRFSTPKQSLGDSQRRQMEAAEEYCKDNNLILDKSLQLNDAGISAFKGANVLRGKLGEFVRLVDEKKVKRGSVLIVENLDRLSRQNALDAQEFFISIINRGVTIVTLTDDQVYSKEIITEKPYLLYTSLGSMMRANEESATKSRRIKSARRARNQKAKEGFKVKAWTPTWCEFKNSGYSVIEARAKVIHRIFKDYKSGKGTFTIARELNRDGVPPIGPRTKEWYKKTLVDILSDKRVIGHAHQIEADNYFPRLISDELFYAVQAGKTSRKSIKGRTAKNIGNIFAGVCRCGFCGGAASFSRTHRSRYSYTYLVCDNARTGKSCEFRSLAYPLTEASFLGFLRHGHLRSFLTGDHAGAAENEVAVIDGKIADLKTRIEKFERAFEDEPNPPKGLMKKLNELELSLETMTEKREEIVAEKHRPTAMLPEELEVVGDLRERINEEMVRLKIREYIRRVVEAIVIYAPHRYVVRFKSGNAFTVFIERKKERNRKPVYTSKCCLGEFEQFDKSAWVTSITSRPDLVKPSKKVKKTGRTYKKLSDPDSVLLSSL